MKKCFLRTIVISCSLILCTALSGCGSDDNTTERIKADFNGHEYKYIDVLTTWEDARKACIAFGGHLATITSAEEADFIQSEFGSVSRSGGGWIGAYSDGAFGGDKDDWCWVTGEEWSYANWEDGEPNNSGGSEWFAALRASMLWNDLDNVDSGHNHRGYICEYDDLKDISEGEEDQESDQQAEQKESQPAEGSDPPETESESEDDWADVLAENTEADPNYKDLGDGRTAIQSHWRGVQIKYPAGYYADVDDDALYVYDGDQMYVFARNITTAAEEHANDLAAFCASKAEDQAMRDFTKLFGEPQEFDNIQRLGGDGKNRVCEIKGNMWNGNYDIWFKSQVIVSGKNSDFLVLKTSFWRYDDKTGSDHYNKVKVTSWGKGDMYGN